MLHIGLDLGSVNSQICIREASGEIVDEQVLPTASLDEFFGLVPSGSRVVLETCSESATVALWAIDAGHDVRMVPATLSRALGVGERSRFRRKYPGEETPACVLRQLEAIDALSEQIKASTREVEKAAEEDPICVLLMTVPGVGPITALTYRVVIDDIGRFPNAHAVESYLGLTPGEDSSSFRQRRTGMTKAGSATVRRSLIQGCWALRRTQRGSELAQWAEAIAQRRGKNIATVALARKVAGIMYAMWRDNREFEPHSQRLAA
jgi:hypothetical protein